ncbi:PP2C family protein-serine/threonine phosphatase [Agromyces protaetiae]|uniref:PP2C family protein-serine/threonine phosphatase n=1 Tax=Agromyces protaetiae TaxID=2509455 RepID=UPI001FB79A71|nr:protein phosphatase 2C domain-containing protein [Agromyces protaetiae]
MPADAEQTLELPGGRVLIAASARSDVGRVRHVNEDSFLAETPVFLVADGMGGHARGDAASQAVVATFRRHLEFGRVSTPEQVLDAIHTANDAVRALSDDGDEGTSVAGTTLAGVALVDAGAGQGVRWMVFNIGDSRVYSWDGRTLLQVSVDHSAVQELMDAGLLDPSEAERHPDRNVITRAIGADAYVEPDVWLLPTTGRQTFLVCSDGLTKELDLAGIAHVLACGTSPDGRASELVDAALAAGGRDNVTAVVVESTIGDPAAAADETTRDRDDVEVAVDVEATTPRDGAQS